MDKLAALKQSQVTGVLSAFIDKGYMQKMAEEDFNYLVTKVAENLDDTYTVNDIANVTEAILNGGVEKTAEEQFVDAVAPVIGAAYMAKMAGEISDEEMEEFADGYVRDALGE